MRPTAIEQLKNHLKAEIRNKHEEELVIHAQIGALENTLRVLETLEYEDEKYAKAKS